MLTTNAGLEALVKEELLEAAAALTPPIAAADVALRPWGCFGRVLLRRRVDADAPPAPAGGSGSGSMCDPPLERVLLRLRSVHDVLWHHARMPLPADAADPPLALYERIVREPQACHVPLLAGGARSFRVSCSAPPTSRSTSRDVKAWSPSRTHETRNERAPPT